MPTISVLMPVYNCERYVAEATESILAQTFSDYEFQIIDDGSTDRSLEILQAYAAKDPRIRLRSRPNTGYVVALNEMLAESQGEFIARMDADDVSLAERFQRQLEFLQGDNKLIAVGSACELINDLGQCLGFWNLPTCSREIDERHINGDGPLIVHPSAMIRTSDLRELGGYRDVTYGSEDYDLWLRLGERGDLVNTAEVLLKYRRHSLSVSHTQRARQARSRLRALTDAHLRRGSLDGGIDQGSFDERVECHDLTWGWLALKQGNKRVACRHAFRALAARPTDLEPWKLAICILRGH